LEGHLGTVIVHYCVSEEIISFKKEKPLALVAAHVWLNAVEA